MPTTVLNPTAGDVHVNKPLTNFSQKWLQNSTAFIALAAMPNMPVANQSDLYYVFDKGDFYRDQAAERADGTESRGGSFKLSTDPYFARVYAFHKDVSDRQRANQDSPVRLDQSATQYVTTKMLIRREAIFASKFMVANVWHNGTAAPTAGTAATWGGVSDPIKEIRGAITAVHEKTGYRPNKMVISRKGYDALLDNDEILSRITGGATTAIPAKVMRTLLAALFELDEIHVMDAVLNDANEGAADSISFIGGDNCLIYYAPNALSLDEPTAAAQFSWTGLLGNTDNGVRIKRFRMEARAADRVEGEMAFDMKVTAGEMGFLFTGVSDVS